MRRFLHVFCALLFCLVPVWADRKPLRIAVVSDIHVQDTTIVRSMDAEVHSTRLFNENYVAALAAFDDIARRGIKDVIITGDLTDNGQKMNVELIGRMLRRYTNIYGMHFFLMTGNHDPSRPFAESNANTELQPWGYKEIHQEWAPFGFMPQKEYLYWATPFSSYSYQNYRYDEALRQSDWSNRTYRYPAQNHSSATYRPDIHDGSYLVEPVKDVWLLAIDASVYHPLKVENDSILTFENAKGGYNEVFDVKPYLLPWIKKVAKEARLRHKTLIAFSHYPMADYNSGAAQYIKDIAMPGRFDMFRFPSDKSSELLADAGITFHLGGHIHLNDDTEFISAKGNRLRNIQIPSTAGYAPAYKILTVADNSPISVSTVPLDSVAGFNVYFSRYRAEYDSLSQKDKSHLWDEQILSSKNYREFCKWHLRELLLLRFLPADFLPVASQQFISMSATQLYQRYGLPAVGPADWNGFDMLFDFYKLRMAGALALSDIPPSRLKQYEMLFSKALGKSSPKDDLDKFFIGLCHIMSLRLKNIN